MKRKRTIIWILLGSLLLLILPGFYNALAIRRYTVEAPGIAHPVRIALITDLHSCAYGDGQRELLDAIEEEAPDLILLGGDIFDDDMPDDNAEAFLRGIGSWYPCYYVTGNHEYWSGADSFAEKMAILEECGITRLSGEVATVEINGTRICICGVDDPYAWADSYGFSERREGSFREQVAQVASQAENGAYTILLTHRPELLDVYSQYAFDLVLAGHAHGGQWRIPGIVNGLWAPNQGLFPAYAGGRYEQDGTTMIVSRGLARESTWVPRWYNRPELVIIDLHQTEDTK
ncbi:MAG: metallophosphoesterase [Acidaminococcaceae bacterium]|nr:metallophosphoesterase [Acidaminococcaceae bacterium]